MRRKHRKREKNFKKLQRKLMTNQNKYDKINSIIKNLKRKENIWQKDICKLIIKSL